jgi:superfamily II RNA helicase
VIYDPFQQKAIEYINQGYSVIVSAPTGAGKTAIAEHVINDCIRRNKKVIYTAPIKALSNQKFREFQEIVPDDVGILTGDVTLNPQARILIMTTEIFRNKILEEKHSLDEYEWIIFDEIHYLDDWERGSVWEESLIFLPDHMKVLGLSATIPNIDELKRWLETIHKTRVKVVLEEERPVPLHFFYQCQGAVFDEIEKVVRYGYQIPGTRYHHGSRVHYTVPLKPNRTTSLIEHLHANDYLPCIYFTFSRKKTEELAGEMMGYNFLNDEEKNEIQAMYHDLCGRFDLGEDGRAKEMLPLIERGVAYHHAGMLPTLKEVVERLFTSRLIKVIFTTETFALGINMPARSVIFDELRKFYGHSFAALRTRDFYQMAGRAGRRGIDSEGFVFCRVNPHDVTVQDLKRIIYGKPEKVHSQFNASYATLLNLYQQYRERLYQIYAQSFHYFQTSRFLRKRAEQLLRGRVDILKELKHIKNEQLTDKGKFASRVYGYELMLAELYETKELEQLSAEELAVLTLAAVYEPHKGVPKPALNRKFRPLEEAMQKIHRHIHRFEKIVRVPTLTKGCHFHLTPVMEAWLKGEPFDAVLRYTQADEGEIVRYLRMTIQLLREMSEGVVSEPFRQKAHKLISRINRDVVDAEKQLRM